MNEKQFESTLAKLNELEAEKASTHQATLASIAAARKQNEQTKVLQAKLATFDEPLAKLKAEADAYVAAVNAEKKRIANEEAARVAAENAKREAEESAKKAAEASELEKAKARIAELEAAAKG